MLLVGYLGLVLFQEGLEIVNYSLTLPLCSPGFVCLNEVKISGKSLPKVYIHFTESRSLVIASL